MTLRRIAIRNYRSIVKAELNLGKITVVIGPSDTGKSNLVRALRDWAFAATGNSMITKGGNTCRVAVAFGARHKIVFEKVIKDQGRGSMRYVVRDGETGETQSYEKIGRTIPVEIQDLTGIRPVKISDDIALKIQFAEQSDPWFLLSSAYTPSMVSRTIGKVSGISALLLANRDLSHQIKAAAREIKSYTDRIEEAEVSLARFERYERAQEVLEQAREILDRIAESKATLAKAAVFLKGVAKRRRRIESLGEFISSATEAGEHIDETRVLDSVDRLNEIRKAQKRIGKLRKGKQAAHDRAEAANWELIECREELSDLITKGLVCPLCGGDAHPSCKKALKAQAERF